MGTFSILSTFLMNAPHEILDLICQLVMEKAFFKYGQIHVYNSGTGADNSHMFNFFINVNRLLIWSFAICFVFPI